jgi:hypothetical protein
VFEQMRAAAATKVIDVAEPDNVHGERAVTHRSRGQKIRYVACAACRGENRLYSGVRALRSQRSLRKDQQRPSRHRIRSRKPQSLRCLDNIGGRSRDVDFVLLRDVLFRDTYMSLALHRSCLFEAQLRKRFVRHTRPETNLARHSRPETKNECHIRESQ